MGGVGATIQHITALIPSNGKTLASTHTVFYCNYPILKYSYSVLKYALNMLYYIYTMVSNLVPAQYI